MANTGTYSFDSPYSGEMIEIERRRKLAELLQQQAAQPLDPNQTAGGYVVPISPLTGLTKLAQGVFAGRGQQGVTDQMKRLAETIRGDRQNTIKEYMAASQGRPAFEDEIGVQVPEQKGNASMANAILAQSRDPSLSALGLGKLTAGPIKIGENDRLVDPSTYQQIVGPAHSMKITDLPKFTPESIAAFLKGGGSDMTLLVPRPNLIATPPAIAALQASLKASGVVEGSPEWTTAFRNLAAKESTHRPPTRVTVNTGENKFEGELGRGVGEAVTQTLTQARGALSTLRTVDQIRGAIDTGKVIAGPGTTARMFLGQVGQVIGAAGKDATEQLTETRKVIQSMAQLELDAATQMKGQGQITEAERGIIRRAASGDIDSMSLPEIRTLMDVLDRTSRFKISQNSENVGRLRANPRMAGVAGYMDVQAPPPYQSQATPSPKAAQPGTAQAIVDELKRRGVVQ